ncbi:MAG: hypothetical protein HY332_20385 [Chloroflexi bacterium]|nr:hypothetical protein [Chloroflexota bacterium]
MELLFYHGRAPVEAAQLEQGRAGRWQIVLYRETDDGPTLYAVRQGGRRRAWGLRDRAAAARWLRRLAAAVQAPLALVVAPS